MNTSELMKAMSDAGAPFEAILIAVRALEDREAIITEKRAVERDRKRRQRERDSHGTVTGQSCDGPEQPSSLDKEIPPTPPKEINLSTRGGNALPRKAGGFSAPDGVEPETWVAFCQQRKKPLTRIAFNRITKTLAEGVEAGWPPGEIAERAVERGYETFFLPNEKQNGQRSSNNQQNGPISPMVAAGIAREARFADRDATPF